MGLTADACIYFDHGLAVFPASASDAWKHPATGEKKGAIWQKLTKWLAV